MPKISKIIYRQLPKISKKHAMYMPKISKQEIRLYGSRHPLSFLYKREKTLFEMIVSVFVSLSCRFRYRSGTIPYLTGCYCLRDGVRLPV